MADLLASLTARARGRLPTARPAVGTRFGPPPTFADDCLLPAGTRPADVAARPASAPGLSLVQSGQQFGTTES